MPSAAFDLIAVPTEDAGKEMRQRPVDELRRQRRAKERNPTNRRVRRDGWLSPLTLDQKTLSLDAQVHRDGMRASDKGFLHVSLRAYLRLLRWTASQGVEGMVSKVPASLASVLKELGIAAPMWRDLVWNWRQYFGRSTCAGRPDSMARDAQRSGKHWHRGQRAAAGCFCV